MRNFTQTNRTDAGPMPDHSPARRRTWAAFWPAAAVVLVIALAATGAVSVYRQSGLPKVTFDGSHIPDRIEITGSYTYADSTATMGFRVASGTSSACSFRYRTPDSPVSPAYFDDALIPGDIKWPDLSLGWQFDLPEDAEPILLSDDTPSEAELETRRLVAIASGVSHYSTYQREYSCDKVIAQLCISHPVTDTPAPMGDPFTLTDEKGTLHLIYQGDIIIDGQGKIEKTEPRLFRVFYQGSNLYTFLPNIVPGAAWLTTRSDGPYLYYMPGGDNSLLPFSGLYGVSLKNLEQRLASGLPAPVPQQLLPPATDVCSVCHFRVSDDGVELVTVNDEGSSIRTAGLSRGEWNPAVTLPGEYASVAVSGEALCVRTVENHSSPAATGGPATLHFGAVSLSSGELLASGDGSDPFYLPQTMTFDALYRNGRLYTLEYPSQTYSDDDNAVPPLISVMDRNGPLRADNDTRLWRRPLLSGLPVPCPASSVSTLTLRFIQEGET